MDDFFDTYRDDSSSAPHDAGTQEMLRRFNELIVEFIFPASDSAQPNAKVRGNRLEALQVCLHEAKKWNPAFGGKSNSTRTLAKAAAKLTSGQSSQSRPSRGKSRCWSEV